VTLYDGREESVEMTQDGKEMAFTWRSSGLFEEAEMVRFVADAHLLRIFPMMRSAGVDGLQAQFSQVTELQLDTEFLPRWDPTDPIVEGDRDESLELFGLPDGFGKIFRYGLGPRRRYRGLIHSVQDHTACTVVRAGLPTDERSGRRRFSHQA
jgi:hypothetical protein